MYRSLRLALSSQTAGRALLPSQRTTAPAWSHFRRSFAAKSGSDAGFVSDSTPEEEQDYEEENLLEGKRTRDNIHTAFASRAMAAMRYDYFTQRAELETEMEAASAFRGLRESAKQQALGYLELMEEFGDADFGSTMDNLEVTAENERELAETICKNYAAIAAEEDLDQVEEWFEDMGAASSRASERLQLVTSMIDAEMMGGEIQEEEDNNDIPEKVKS